MYKFHLSIHVLRTRSCFKASPAHPHSWALFLNKQTPVCLSPRFEARLEETNAGLRCSTHFLSPSPAHPLALSQFSIRLRR